tara:strand:+ start:145 stop:351 length:207 start_codon:yes stop_codon:yes gene_type:complete
MISNIFDTKTEEEGYANFSLQVDDVLDLNEEWTESDVINFLERNEFLIQNSIRDFAIKYTANLMAYDE